MSDLHGETARLTERAPKRVQLRRTKGYRKPIDAIVVSRPSRWGNPFVLGRDGRGLVRYGPHHLERFGREWDYEGRISCDGNRHDMWFSQDDIVETHVRWATRAEVVELFRLTIVAPTPGMVMAYPSAKGYFLGQNALADIRINLAGHDLACWCALDKPCHADVLLDLANRPLTLHADEAIAPGDEHYQRGHNGRDAR